MDNCKLEIVKGEDGPALKVTEPCGRIYFIDPFECDDHDHIAMSVEVWEGTKSTKTFDVFIDPKKESMKPVYGG